MSEEVTIYQQPEGLSLVDMRAKPDVYIRLSKYRPNTAQHRLQGIVAMAYTYTGRDFDRNALALVASALYTELMRDPDGVGTKNICIEEIGYAIRQAVLGDDMYGINVASLYKAVRNYCTGEGHEAQRQANDRRAAERRAQLKASAVGAMLESYAGKMLLNTKNK